MKNKHRPASNLATPTFSLSAVNCVDHNNSRNHWTAFTYLLTWTRYTLNKNVTVCCSPQIWDLKWQNLTRNHKRSCCLLNCNSNIQQIKLKQLPLKPTSLEYETVSLSNSFQSQICNKMEEKGLPATTSSCGINFPSRSIGSSYITSRYNSMNGRNSSVKRELNSHLIQTDHWLEREEVSNKTLSSTNALATSENNGQEVEQQIWFLRIRSNSMKKGNFSVLLFSTCSRAFFPSSEGVTNSSFRIVVTGIIGILLTSGTLNSSEVQWATNRVLKTT